MKIFAKILGIFMAAGMAFGLAACDNGGDGGESGGKTQYTVTFHMQGHGEAVPAQKVDKDGYATQPSPEPSDADNNFLGWYKAAEGGDKFVFNQEKIQKDTDVYAHWEAKSASDASVKLTGKVYLVGDSTVCNYSPLDNAYLPRYGYGMELYNYLNCEPSQIVNLALSGRSSLSFLSEAKYQTLTDSANGIKSGDYLIIGFGHNDEKADDSARHTEPTGSYTEPTKNGAPSFQYTLYENYVKIAKERGATPILCTPIVRYSDNGSYTGDKVHITSEGDYAAAVRKLAADTDTALVDLTEITKAIYTADNAAAQYFHCHTGYSGEKPNETPIGKDNTHLNRFGAKRVAYELLKALPATCGLKANVKTTAAAPSYENDFASAIKTDFVKQPYTAPSLGSPIATTQTATEANWYKSAFGSLGGDGKVSNFAISYADGKFTVDNSGTPTGKFESAGDGIGAAFVQIDSGKNFTASATVTVITKTTDTKGQAGFGMMLRDDMYMNKGKDIVVNANFVAAGVLGTGAIFKREETALSPSGHTTTVNEGSQYNVSITRLGTTITATFSDGTNSYSKGYLDLKTNVVDGEYMYLCLFANRGYKVEFTNVQFEITGDATGA